MRFDDRTNDRQSQSGAPVSVSRFVEPDEPFEDPLSVFGSDPGAVVVDHQHGETVVLAELQDNPVGPMLCGIVQQIADRLKKK